MPASRLGPPGGDAALTTISIAPAMIPGVGRSTLNQKVFKKMGFQLQKEEMDALCNCQTQAVERLLKTLQMKMAKYGARKAAAADASTAADSHAAPPSGGTASRATPRVSAPRSGAPPGRTDRAASRRGSSRWARRMEACGAAAEKDLNIRELRETVDILEIKIQKLEQLVRLKDSKIATLHAKLQQQQQM